MPGTQPTTRHGTRHSIRTRVTAGATAIVTLILVVSAVVAVLVLGRVLTASVEESAEQDLDSLSSQVENDPSRAESIITGVDDDQLVRFNAAGDTGTVVNDDEADQLPEPGESSRQVTVDDEPYLVVSEDTDAGTFTVARTTEHVDETVSATTILLAVAVPLVIVLVGAVVWIVTGRALRPVERLRRQVDSITADELSRRVDAGDDELGALATTMNRMLARLEHSQAVQRRFVSDASHELRSPLATMRQHAELGASYPDATSLHELSEVVLDEGERMQNLVEGLLLLARLDENHRPPTEPVDLDDLLLAEADRLKRISALTVDTSGVDAAQVEGNPRLLGRAVRNLVDNAARHAESRVVLGLRITDRTTSAVVLTVADDGAGVPKNDRERIFDRFARLDEGRARDAGGSGLGLAIVKEIVQAHHGQVVVGESTDDATHGGAVFTVALPR
ncbi:MAG: ATP-binding protein [Corynebacterium sp.]|uniref:sensor histidine kinase n=1 Tax=unclassified Corynebacterium TaxID=2624378 RepID=UPI00095F48D0|nr:HAMP domain-containing sensor histidine kinase [Corynebacterium sp. CNJ-954]OLT52643.1 two-component sensor histidine kinase [Corynebacterium sp. CNJ-954]